MAVLEVTNLGSTGVTISLDFTAFGREINTKIAESLLREAQTNAREFRDTGALTDSIESRVTELTSEVRTTLPYAAAQEVGRAAGARMPPIDALRSWADRHGIEEDSLYVIARAIARRGLPSRFFMRRALETTDKQIPRIIDAAAREIGLL